ncbi:hypothetical protein CDAR_244241 [Caerostris darwini]|uniref:Uncharacterized protein n=1 Tax=Caerostris darwini TaxID=1538125 RepID=A0AAV4RCX7_9ARAC|nr:hypothetical protein CDAR_244241 [Caerostris darwini]
MGHDGVIRALYHKMKLFLLVAVAFCVALCVLQAQAAPEPGPAVRIARQASNDGEGNLLILDLSLISELLTALLSALLGKPVNVG